MKKNHLKPIILNSSKKELKIQKLNDNKIRKELKWKQTTTLKNGLTKTIAWYRKNYSLIKG